MRLQVNIIFLQRSLQQWKKQFLENIVLAFDKSVIVKEYKGKIDTLKEEKDAIAKRLGEVIIERYWVEKKLNCLGLSIKRVLINKSEGVQIKSKNHSLNRQLELLGMSKSLYYYKHIIPFNSNNDKKFFNGIYKIYIEHLYYGTKQMVIALKEEGFYVDRKIVKKSFDYLGIQTLYPKPKTTVSNRLDYKYPYFLDKFKDNNGLVKINKPNIVWSGDITYIKLKNGFAYLYIIIDWHIKKIIGWKLFNSIDAELTTSVLKEVLLKHSKLTIFNTNQGSQYTAKENIQILIDNGVSIFIETKNSSIDNITIERFCRILKYGNVYPSYNTIKEIRYGI